MIVTVTVVIPVMVRVMAMATVMGTLLQAKAVTSMYCSDAFGVSRSRLTRCNLRRPRQCPRIGHSRCHHQVCFSCLHSQFIHTCMHTISYTRMHTMSYTRMHTCTHARDLTDLWIVHRSKNRSSTSMCPRSTLDAEQAAFILTCFGAYTLFLETKNATCVQDQPVDLM